MWVLMEARASMDLLESELQALELANVCSGI